MPRSSFESLYRSSLQGPTSPLGLVLAAYCGQGSHATVSKAEIEAVCTAYFAAHACFGGVLRPGEAWKAFTGEAMPMSYTYGDPSAALPRPRLGRGRRIWLVRQTNRFRRLFSPRICRQTELFHRSPMTWSSRLHPQAFIVFLGDVPSLPEAFRRVTLRSGRVAHNERYPHFNGSV